MRILLLTHGTRGDVQPFLALAGALESAGHAVRIAGPAGSAPLAAARGLSYFPVDDGPLALMGDPDSGGVMETGLRGARGAVQAVRLIRRINPLMRQVCEDMADAAEEGADAVVHLLGTPGHHIAEKLGAVAVPVALQPSWIPTRAFPAPGVPWPRWMPRVFNKASYRLAGMALRGQRRVHDRFRAQRLGLGARPGAHDPLHTPHGHPRPLLQGFSRHLLPAETGYPPQVRTTGFWFPPPEDSWVPTAELSSFLESGPAPVVIGFSSAPTADPAAAGRLLAGAARRSGVRAVIATGWGGIAPEDSGDDVITVDQVPHDRVFPHCAAVVHHGGGGTTGAALAAGRPQVICPFWGDQPFWAERAHASGVAPAPLRGQELSQERLAAALREAVSDDAIAARARELGEKARAEEGVQAAVRLVEQARADGSP